MKKIISIVICLQLILALNVCATEITQEQQEQLKSYNIMVGDEKGLRLDDNVTRAEFSKMALASKGIVFSFDKETLLSMECTFSDITKYDWQFQYINFAIAMGYFKSENNISGADQEVLCQEAIDILTDTLGYRSTNDTEKENIKSALLKDIDIAETDVLTRKASAKLICNALDIPVMVMTSFDAEKGAVYEILDGTDKKEFKTLRTDLEK